MDPLVRRALATIRRYDLVPRGGRVLAAVSGGPDSVAMAHVLLALQADGELTIAALAHFNHRLRGADSDADEQFTRELAGSLGLAFELGSEDVRTRAEETRRSVEVVGREARYRFLGEACRRLDADRIAVAHTRDDQAETVLLKLFRGAGLGGLAGIYPRRGRVIRPVLEMGRDDLRAYLAAHGIASREDLSNLDLANPRNRVRHELIPYLTRHFSGDIVGVLARQADLSRDLAAWIDSVATETAAALVLSHNGTGLTLDAAKLAAADRGLGLAVARDLLRRVAPTRFIGYDHAARLLELAGAGGTGRVDLPGQQAELAAGRLTLRARKGRRPADKPAANSFPVLLSIPGEAVLEGLGMTIAGRLTAGVPTGLAADSVALDADAPTLPLGIRTRRPGDSMRPLGLGGRKKLQDLLVDRKVPRSERDRIPIVVDARDRIVWVTGIAAAEDFRITDRTRAVIILKAKRLGEEP
jgi:tRNA(Ile)-lysidine synthase